LKLFQKSKTIKMNPNEIPSLSQLLDKHLTAEVVPGVVEDDSYRAFHTFSIPSDDVAKMTASEVYELYLKPVIVNYIAPCINKLGRVCTRAMGLPSKDSKVIGFRCWKGKIPVNVYIARRPNPDRHQFIVEAMVYPKPLENDDEVQTN